MSYDVEVEEIASLDVTKQTAAIAADTTTAAKPMTASTEAQDTVAAAQTAYFTEGEMVPWKGRWFRIHLIELNGQKHLVLKMLKPTAASAKRKLRQDRWLRQHPRSVASARDLSLLRAQSQAQA